MHVPSTEDGSGGGAPDFVVLTYTDESGASWQRRSDTRELRSTAPGIRWRQRAVHWLAVHVPGFHRVALAPPERRAVKATRKHGPDQLPLSLRWCRWVWGYRAAGEGDDWMKPEGAPTLWGYSELPWTSGEPDVDLSRD